MLITDLDGPLSARNDYGESPRDPPFPASRLDDVALVVLDASAAVFAILYF